MNHQATITLVGRGPSAKAAPKPIGGNGVRMAVSSGIWMFDANCPPEYFVSLDSLKFFQAGLWPDHQMAWQHDEDVDQWPFWADARIEKHLNGYLNRPTVYRRLPPEVLDHIPKHHLDAFHRELITNGMHIFGFQPGWADAPNGKFWPIDIKAPPRFSHGGLLGLDGCANSTLMAIQVAHQLGFQRLLFLGIDLNESYHKLTVDTIRRWHPQAVEAGYEWLSLSPDSALAGFLHTPTTEEAMV